MADPIVTPPSPLFNSNWPYPQDLESQASTSEGNEGQARREAVDLYPQDLESQASTSEGNEGQARREPVDLTKMPKKPKKSKESKESGTDETEPYSKHIISRGFGKKNKKIYLPTRALPCLTRLFKMRYSLGRSDDQVTKILYYSALQGLPRIVQWALERQPNYLRWRQGRPTNAALFAAFGPSSTDQRAKLHSSRYIKVGRLDPMEALPEARLNCVKMITEDILRYNCEHWGSRDRYFPHTYVNPLGPDHLGRTPLFYTRDEIEIYRHLLSIGKKIKGLTLSHQVAIDELFHAVKIGEVDFIDSLIGLSPGVDLNTPNDNKDTLLMVAAMKGKPEVFSKLILLNVDTEYVNPRTKKNVAMLVEGNSEMMELLNRPITKEEQEVLLVQKCKELSVQTLTELKSLEQPLRRELLCKVFWALISTRRNDPAYMELVIRALNKLNSLGELDLNARSDKGEIPINEVIEKGSLEILDWLLANGVSLVVRDKRGRSAFLCALERRNAKAWERLENKMYEKKKELRALEEEGDVPPKVREELTALTPDTALKCLDMHYERERSRQAFDNSCEPARRERAQGMAKRALDEQERERRREGSRNQARADTDRIILGPERREILRDILIEACRKPDTRKDTKKKLQKLLMMDVGRGDTDCVEALLEAGLDPNFRFNKVGDDMFPRRTPLIHALCKNKPRTFSLLLDNGANMWSTDGDGKTVLMHLVEQEWTKAFADEILGDREIASGVNLADKRGRTPLMVLAASVSSKSSIRIEKLLRAGAYINAQDKWGRTALMYAVVNENSNAVQTLLQSGANPALLGVDGYGAMELAFVPHADCRRVVNLQTIELLIEAGIPLPTRKIAKATPLGHAVGRINEDQELVHRILLHGEDVNRVCQDRDTPLLLAARRGNFDTVATLISWGADLNSVDADGNSAIMVVGRRTSSRRRGKIFARIFDLLMASGASLDIVNRKRESVEDLIPLIHEHVRREVTVYKSRELFVPMRTEDETLRESLEKITRNPELLNTLKGELEETVLHSAIRHQDSAAINMLLSQPDIDINTADTKQTTPLISASVRGMVGVVRRLIDMGADVNATRHNGETALIQAVKQEAVPNRAGVINLLLSAPGIKPNIADETGNTALAHAALHERLGPLKQLLAAGVDRSRAAIATITKADSRIFEISA